MSVLTMCLLIRGGRSSMRGVAAGRGGRPGGACGRWVWRLGEGLGAVLLVGDVVEPGDDLTVLVCLLHRDVCHVPVGGRAVPVLLARLDVDDVARADLLDPVASGRDEADAVGDVEGLALGVVVPGGAGSRGEPDVGAADG